VSVFRRDKIQPEDPARTASRAITAAATRLNRSDRSEVERVAKRRQSSGWQDDAWAMYDAIGEIKYGFNLVAWAISRCRIYAGVLPEEGGGDPVEVHEQLDLSPGLADASTRALHRLGTGPHMSELLRTLAVNMQVAGECWLVQQPRQIMSEKPERWSIKSVNELRVDSSGAFTLLRAPNSTQDVEELPSNAYVARLWKNHPRFYENADSSMLGVLDKCDELLMLDRMIRGVARSRINAGILAISENFSLLDDPDDEGDPVRFEEEFQYAMSQPISDESSASANIPLLIRGPLDEIKDGIHYYEIARSVSADLVARADRVLERILQGIDLPKDMVTGLAQVKYSNALVISDSLYSAHIHDALPICICARRCWPTASPRSRPSGWSCGTTLPRFCRTPTRASPPARAWTTSRSASRRGDARTATPRRTRRRPTSSCCGSCSPGPVSRTRPRSRSSGRSLPPSWRRLGRRIRPVPSAPSLQRSRASSRALPLRRPRTTQARLLLQPHRPAEASSATCSGRSPRPDGVRALVDRERGTGLHDQAACGRASRAEQRAVT
jgi:hypothetical protein